MRKTLLLLCLTTLQLSAQTRFSPATRQLLRAVQTAVPARDATSAPLRANSAVERLVPAYLQVTPTASRSQLAELGVRVNLDLDTLLTVQLPLSAFERLSEVEGVRYVQTGTTVYPQLDRAKAETGVDRLQGGTDAVLGRAYTGQGVVIGVVDAGFDYTHPAFYTADGTTLRLRRVWEQATTIGTPPEGFTYGSEFTTPEELLRYMGDVTGNSHGTHVAAMAAGAYSAEDAPYAGVAPEADLVFVSKGDVTENNVNISDAIAYIFRYADEVGKPCVVNLSLGNHLGPHDGTSAFDIVADGLQSEGHLLVGSVGNFRRYPLHVSKVFAGATDEPLRTLADYFASPSYSNCGGDVDVWGEKGMEYDVQVVVQNLSADTTVIASEAIHVGEGEGTSYTFSLNKSSKGKVYIDTEINPLNGKPHAQIALRATTLKAGHTLGLVITPRTAGRVDAWADGAYLALGDGGLSTWTPGDTDRTLAEIGGTGKRIISVGAYTTRDRFLAEGTAGDSVATGETLHALASFSSAGPALDGRMKPEVCAPGSYIISALSSHDGYVGTYYPVARTVTFGEKNYTYGYMQGTSMAAPFVTGVVATWLEANPRLTPELLRTVLSETSRTDTFTAVGQEGADWGFGKIDAYAGLCRSLELVGIDTPQVSADAAVRYDAGRGTLLFAAAVPSADLCVYHSDGRLLFRRALTDVRAGSEVALPLSAHGLYIVRVGNGTSLKILK
ncbi:MAG: S8 family serine peptidase [Alloprevotella sp.]